jgi:signal transduction histidine kinase
MEIVYLALYMYVFAITIGTIFSRNKEIIIREKLRGIQSVAASMAHELRTPLRIINTGAHGIKNHFSDLFNGYLLAKQANLPVKYISPEKVETLLTVCDDIGSEADAAFTVINILLTNVTQNVENRDFKTTSIEKCIDESLKRYPYDLLEAGLIHWDAKNDFLFYGNELLIIHVLFNLLKNALYQIKAARKGEIFIWTEPREKYNLLHFKDTAQGIPPKILARLFDRFYTQTYHGTGIGLAFCKIVMENLKGKIACESVEGEYAHFILHFPKDQKPLSAEAKDLSTQLSISERP